MSGKAFELTVNEVTGNDTTSAAVDDYNVLHFVAAVKLYGAGVNLAHQGRVSTEQELLTGLTLCVERTAYLYTTE